MDAGSAGRLPRGADETHAEAEDGGGEKQRAGRR
jgi:hypothetical protein